MVVAAPGGFGPAVVASPLWRLLPFATSAPPVWTARPASTVRPTADADAPRLSADPAEEARRWSAFPSADGRLPLVDLRPDARPLLVAGGADDAANADAVPVLVERRIGAGRSLCLATDRSWQWRARDADAHDRFWAALVRTAAGPAYAAEQGGVSLDADAFVAPPGAAVRYRVRAVDAGGLAVARTIDRTLRLVGPAAQLVRTVPLTPRPGGRFDAVVVGLPAGEYMVETSWPLGPRVPLRVRPSYTAELADLTGDDAPLRRLAAATGGRLFRLDQLDRLAAALTDRTATPARPIDLPLWHGTYLVPLLVGLLTAEWASAAAPAWRDARRERDGRRRGRQQSLTPPRRNHCEARRRKRLPRRSPERPSDPDRWSGLLRATSTGLSRSVTRRRLRYPEDPDHPPSDPGLRRTSDAGVDERHTRPDHESPPASDPPAAGRPSGMNSIPTRRRQTSSVCRHCRCDLSLAEQCSICDRPLDGQCAACHHELSHDVIVDQNIHFVGGRSGRRDDADAFLPSWRNA